MAPRRTLSSAVAMLPYPVRTTIAVRLVLHQGLQLAALGAVIGVVAAAIAARGTASVLYGISPHDPLTMTAVTLLLLGIAALACYVPARRAMRVDPIVALRAE
jgi:ABC-type antimicrobial peptide transport system permease subunit